VAVKLLMTWDILPGQEQEYFEFIVREWIPGLQKMGMEPSDAWFTMYGSRPQIMAAVQMANLSSLQHVLETPAWKELTQRLDEYVENLDYKVVQARAGFQL
jgi:hypothetical protein